MATSILPAMARAAWDLVIRQHGVIARWQLLDLGFSAAAIRHRLDAGRLFAIHRGVYAVGRKELPQKGRWMAAVLAAGPGAMLSHQSAAELWGIRSLLNGVIEVSVPQDSSRRRKGLRIHKLSPRVAGPVVDGIPLTDVVTTLVQLAPRLTVGELERAINEADRLDLIDPEALRGRLECFARYPGVRPLRTALDRRTFAMSRSELERRFRPIAERVGLPTPETCVMRNGWEVDFFWRDLRLVVETDGLRHHRTPAQQHRDRVRDQVHLAAGDTPLRFTHGQVRYEPDYVERTLGRVVSQLLQRREQR